jgi:hypothetical protein
MKDLCDGWNIKWTCGMGCKKFTRYFDWHIRSQERFEDLGTKRPINLKCLECV